MKREKTLLARIRELEEEISLLRLCLLDTSAITARCAVVRMARLLALVRDSDHPSATRLAAELGTSTKTIHRDLHWLKSGLRLPLVFDVKRNGWRLDGPATLSVSAGLTQQNELAALLSAHTKGKKS